HGIVAWALAVLISGVVVAGSAASLASKTAPPATSSATTAGEPLIAYELDRLFRGDRHAVEGDITYARAEAARILLMATGRQGISPNDRTYLASLIAARTGIAQPDAERRLEEAITAASGAQSPSKRRHPGLCHRRITPGRGCCCVVRRVRRRASSGQR